ncbi:hypothetical protein ACFFV7_31380 [Nonomuraea spiralis]|uniref:O-antigen/teichoic acid export membrane protein n=1 Tax=Nonomuraea spiralis TaxID=46182 RepID=A0ABV5IP10_9ACTN|nr:hypothetical protein [Nonomuraea spiralis]GGT00627.1 hypothetical protein GCM10010176_050710 [Nonomuraea spiralis]
MIVGLRRRPPPRLVAVTAALFAGRGAFRAALWTANLVLLGMWGADEFALYATANGVSGWLLALTSSGIEKAALALVPRRGGQGLRPLFMLLAATPFTLAVPVWLALAAADPGGAPARYAAAAAYACGLGCCAVMAALNRLRGRARADVFAYLTLAVAQASGVGLVAWTGMGANGLLAVHVGVLAVLNGVLAAGLLRRRPGAPGKGAYRPAVRAAALLSVGEVTSVAATSVTFAYFAHLDDAQKTSVFYVWSVALSVVVMGVSYLLRILQPRVAVWIEGMGEAGARRMARRILAPAVPAGVVAVVVLSVLLAGGQRGVVATGAALLVEAVLTAAVLPAFLLVENTDDRGRRLAAVAACLQFAVVAAAGWFLVPAAAAFGALLAYCAGEVVKGGVMLATLRKETS